MNTYTNPINNPYFNEELARYENRRRLKPTEKLALYRWLSTGHRLQDAPQSRHLYLSDTPAGWDFIDVYRLDKEIDSDIRGMNRFQKADYFRTYFGYDGPDMQDEDLPFDDDGLDLSNPDNQRMVKRKLFWMWEFITTEDLSEEAEEYIKEHMDQQTPLEW